MALVSGMKPSVTLRSLSLYFARSGDGKVRAMPVLVTFFMALEIPSTMQRIYCIARKHVTLGTTHLADG